MKEKTAYEKRIDLMMEVELEIDRLKIALKEYRKEMKEHPYYKGELYPSHKFAAVKRKSMDLTTTLVKLRVTQVN